jgi:hypothetical protein
LKIPSSFHRRPSATLPARHQALRGRGAEEDSASAGGEPSECVGLLDGICPYHDRRDEMLHPNLGQARRDTLGSEALVDF